MIYLQEGHVVLPAGLGAPSSTSSTPANPKLQAKVTDSSTEIQTLLPDPGYDGLSSVMVLGVDRHIDSNIKPENIKSGIDILGVQGTLVQEQIHNQDKEITENGFYTYDAGFTGLESVTVKVPGPVLSKVTITKNGTYTPEAGIDGFSSVDVEVPEVLPVIKELKITPSVEEQVHTVPEGADGFGPVMVHGVDSTIDTNIIPGNIKSGVSILGVQGTLVQTQIHNQDKEITANGTYTHDAGFTGFGKITVDVPITQPALAALVVDPSTNEQTLTPSTGVDGFNQVTVHGVDNTIDTNITPENIKSGVSILGVDGTFEQKVEYNIDEPSIVISYVPIRTGTWQVIEPVVVKYVSKMVVDGVDTPVPTNGRVNFTSTIVKTIAWYFNYSLYNTDHNYSAGYGYKCLPQFAFGDDALDNFDTLSGVQLGDVNVIEHDSLPYVTNNYDLTFSRPMKIIKHIPLSLSKLEINAPVDELNSFYMYGAAKAYVRATINYVDGTTNPVYWYRGSAVKNPITYLAPVVRVKTKGFPFSPESADRANVIDINEGTVQLNNFGYKDTGATWVNAVDTFVMPSTLIYPGTFTFNDDVILDKIVCFNTSMFTPLEVVRESGTKQHNGTLFVPEGATGYDSWLTKLNTVGTWTIKYFKAVKTPEFKGSASGYYGYTDPNTGKHLFVDLN